MLSNCPIGLRSRGAVLDEPQEEYFMRPRHLLLSLAVVALLPVQSRAEVKTYTMDVLTHPGPWRLSTIC